MTAEERSNVEELVRNELSNQNNSANYPLHPLVEQMLPLTENNEINHTRPALLHEIERYEEEQQHEADFDESNIGIIENGIDMSRYSQFTAKNESGKETILYDNMYSTLSYSLLQNRNLSLLSQNEDQIRNLQLQHLNNLTVIEEEYTNDLHQKRQRIDDVNTTRKRRQVEDFKPVNDYLNDRWKEGIKSVVDLGIEAGRMNMNPH